MSVCSTAAAAATGRDRAWWIRRCLLVAALLGWWLLVWSLSLLGLDDYRNPTRMREPLGWPTRSTLWREYRFDYLRVVPGGPHP